MKCEVLFIVAFGLYVSILIFVVSQCLEVLLLFRTKPFPESATRNITYQVLQGLAYMHKNGLFTFYCYC